MPVWERVHKSIVEELKPDSPILKECRKPPIKFIKHHDYGVRKLEQRLKESKDR